MGAKTKSAEAEAAAKVLKASTDALDLVAKAAAAAVDLAANATAKATSLAANTTDTAAKLEKHEAVCAERYAGILSSLSGIDGSVGTIFKLVWTANGMIIVVLLGIVGFFFARGWGH